jgi:hypothetical protein
MGGEGSNIFIKGLVQRPCAGCSAVFFIVMAMSYFSVQMIIAEGTDIFGSVESNDIHDVRTGQVDALAMAREAMPMPTKEDMGEVEMCPLGPPGAFRPCETEDFPPLSQSSDRVLTCMEAKEGQKTIFNKENIARIKEIEDIIIKNKRYKEFCQRAPPDYEECTPILSPVNMFYVDTTKMNGMSMKDIADEIDGIDGNMDGRLEVLLAENLRDFTGAIVGQIMGEQAMAFETMDMECAMSQECIMSRVEASLDWENMPPGMANAFEVYKVLDPLVSRMHGALYKPRADKQQDVSATLRLASYMQVSEVYSQHVDFYFDKDFSIETPESLVTRGVISFGAPLPGYKNRDDRRQEQREEMVAWFRKEFDQPLKDAQNSGNVDLLFFATPLVGEEFLAILLGDATKALIALTLVFVWLWVQTGSQILAWGGIMEIFLSVPIALFVYRKVLGLSYFAPLNMMTLFIVAAIGADDIFVFMGAYEQSGRDPKLCTSLETRMTMVYRRAAGAMFITSLTTCAAFSATAFSPLPDVQSFGIFSAIVIAVDYVLVITWFPCIVVLYHNSCEKRPFCYCLQRWREMWCCDGHLKDAGNGKWQWQMTKAMVTTTERGAARKTEEPAKEFLIERVLTTPMTRLLAKRPLAVVIFFLVFLVPVVITAAQIEPASRAEQGLPEDHPFQRIFTILNERFPASAETPSHAAHLVWGIEGVDRSSVSLLRDSTNRGDLLMNEDFSFNEDTQNYILKVCDDVHAYGDDISGFLESVAGEEIVRGDVECIVHELRDWRQKRNEVFPIPLEDVPAAMKLFLAEPKVGQWKNTTIGEAWDGSIGVNEAFEVKFLTVQVRSQLAQMSSHPRPRLVDHYERFEAWVEKLDADAPSSAKGVYQIIDGDFDGPLWVWMNTQLVYISSAVTGICAGAVLAFTVILFATTQVIIAVAALVTILAILAIVLASMVVAGFTLGTITSICITLLAGFSVDYVVHLAHAFEHSHAPTRAEKFQDAMAEMGVAVFSGMLTSGLAAATLFLCTLQFFSKFGFFLLVTVVASWVLASCFFMTLMHVIGPDDTTPRSLQFPANVLCKWRVLPRGELEGSKAVQVARPDAGDGDVSAASA